MNIRFKCFPDFMVYAVTQKFGRDIGGLILECMWKCDNCRVYEIGHDWNCEICSPQQKLCRDCFELKATNCEPPNKIIQCDFCGVWHCEYHSHWWWIDKLRNPIPPHTQIDFDSDSDSMEY